MATPFLSSPVLIMGPIVADHASAPARASIVRLSAADDDHLAREEGQPLDATLRRIERDEVLDPHTHVPIDIDPRLDREDGRTRQRGLCGEPAERWHLVRREAD